MVIFYLTGCKAQEQIMVEPCAQESIAFDPTLTKEWKALLIPKMNDIGFSLTDESNSLGKLLGGNVFYIRIYDKQYLEIDKGGYSISIDNVEVPEELHITVFNSKDDDVEYCQKLANEIKSLLSDS